jgi:hypothetical protein
MIQVKFVPRPFLPAVLASALIASVDVIPAKANLTLGHPIITDKQNDSRNPDHPIDHADRFVMDGHREIAPTVKSLVLLIHRFRNPLIKQREGAAHRSDMDR